MDKKTNIAIQTTLNQIGVPHSLKGYTYLVSAIEKCIADRSKVSHITKVLYKEIADENYISFPALKKRIRRMKQLCGVEGRQELERLVTEFDLQFNR